MVIDVELAERVGYVIVARVITILGIIGNFMSIFILQRRRLNDSPYTYLSAITVADLITLTIFLGVGFVRCGTCQFTDEQAYYTKYYELFVYLPFVNMASNTSLFIAVAMTAERFIFVRFPLIAKKVCDRKKARLLTGIIVFLAITVNVPRFFLFSICRQPECNVAKIPGMLQPPIQMLPLFLTVECAYAPKGDPASKSPNSESGSGMSRCVLFSGYNSSTELEGISIVVRPMVPGKTNGSNGNFSTFSEHVESRSRKVFDLRIRKCDAKDDVLNHNVSKNGSVTPTDKNASTVPTEDWQDTESYYFYNWTTFLKPNLFAPILYSTSYFGSKFFDKFASLPYSSYHAATDTVELYWKRNDSTAISKSIQPLLQTFYYHVIINITSKDLIRNLLKQLPCLIKKNETNVTRPPNPSKATTCKPAKIPAIPYDPNFVKFTKFYMEFHEIVYHVVVALEATAAITIIILNVLLVRILRKNFSKRKALLLASTTYCSPRASMSVAAYTKHVHEQQRLTVTLVIITFLVAISTAFGVITSDPVCKLIYSNPHYRQNKGYRVYGMVANLLVTVNHSINFALYALFNKRFQQELRNVFNSTCGRCCSCIKSRCSKEDTPVNHHRRLNSVRTISTSSSWTEEMTSVTSCPEVDLRSVTSIKDLSL